jgi:hypothetical protein
MDKQQLARELRQRQREQGFLTPEIIDAVSDDQIIDSYITCSHCGTKQVNQQELRDIISIAETVEHFFALCDSLPYTFFLLNGDMELNKNRQIFVNKML